MILAGLTVFLAALALIVAGLSAASMPSSWPHGGQRGRGRRRFHGQPGHGQPARPGGDARPVISTYFVFAYVGLTVPVIAVGFGAQAFGDFRATLASPSPSR